MPRKIILDTGHRGGINMLNYMLNEKNKENIDITHLLLSTITMTGVDRIQPLLNEWGDTNTTLIKGVGSKSNLMKWVKCNQKVNDILKNYISKEELKKVDIELIRIKHIIQGLFFAMETNSAVFSLSGWSMPNYKNQIPQEIILPVEILMSTIQKKNAQLPIVRGDIERKDIQRLVGVLESKKFNNYKESHAQIEQSSKLNSKIINQIEKAGKELVINNTKLFEIKANFINAIPLGSKVIDLFFGKLPGIISEYAGNLVTDYLKGYISVPIYSCEDIIREQFKKQNLIYTTNKKGERILSKI